MQRRSDEWGHISVTLERRDQEEWLVVQDGGKQARLLILTVQASLFGLREEWVWNQQLTI